jgi:hypothetical protein
LHPRPPSSGRCGVAWLAARGLRDVGDAGPAAEVGACAEDGCRTDLGALLRHPAVIFGDRDQTIHDDNEISLERRNGYSWYALDRPTIRQ